MRRYPIPKTIAMAAESIHTTILTRKIRKRAGHRATATRLINELDNVIVAADRSRLTQLRQSLRDKIGILSSLDEEISSMIAVEHIEAEVEQADLVKEKIELAVINVETALDQICESPRPKSPVTRTSSPHVESRSSSRAHSKTGEFV